MFEGSWSKVSNRADWIDCIELLDQETDEPLDLSGLQEIVVQITYPVYNDSNPVYGAYTGTAANFIGAQVSLTGGGVQHVQLGVFQFWFPATVMRALPPQVYNMGIVLISADGITSQFMIGTVPVMEGFALSAPISI